MRAHVYVCARECMHIRAAVSLAGIMLYSLLSAPSAALLSCLREFMSRATCAKLAEAWLLVNRRSRDLRAGELLIFNRCVAPRLCYFDNATMQFAPTFDARD